MVIKVEGYTPEIANRVYTKESFSDEGDSEEIHEVICLARFVEPSKKEVIKNLIQTTDKFSRKNPFQNPNSIDSDLEMILAQLPDFIKNDIVNERNNCLNFVRWNTFAREIPKGKSPEEFMLLRYGLIPSMMVEDYTRGVENRSGNWYEERLSDEGLMKEGLGKKVELTIKYDPLEGKLNEGVEDEYKEIRDIIDIAYNSVKGPENFYLLPDISKKILEEATIEPALKLLRSSLGDSDEKIL